ncbi:TIGR01777 family protein [Vibrio sp. V27_P1S3P104]|uniref:TIGR01777 family oxidoreductase n=1 Tax=unclassified Vibrio TaxID=2614977 RepID=UPI0013728CFE|nr:MULTISPECIES: TIGR01777 family oxidoreductase [unclassified Vibrio]NAW68594.1 TIGR01777 family protein [Vibrio sp. V28_P6S34P95]NAX05435.1 TIGR01777 family protein [Vibrio sp. V30_P3S12P165]NAX35326.1 TIGR01777 family protein [Vibrio sp. V29_P1S30P107]NAX36228.1 TIGR01777 family protein [Vibrio sp. V27_P1S3P104]NAX41409.1 TIGR01777 family protein [Vibrio sp. V26_P1S5P106]
MKILITGATGLIGRELVKHLMIHDLVILSRDIDRAKQQLIHVHAQSLSFINNLDMLSNLDGYHAVINLAGEPIADKRWTESQKQRICQSRWSITEKLVALIHASTAPPSVFISGSAVGYYGDQQAHPFDESRQVHSSQFPHQICAKWEQIARRAQTERTRVCLLRTGIVLSTDGGALMKMLLPYRYGLGGPIGKGDQYMPWIHIIDMVRAITYLLETEHAHGAFNLCAPHPVTNRVFSRCLASTLKRPHLLFTPKWAIRLLMGEASILLFDSIRSKPKKLTELGFQFTYSRLEPALKQLLQHHH